MKFKIICFIVFIAIALTAISGCGMANTLTDDAGELQLRDDKDDENEEESPTEIIIPEPTPTTELMTASPFAYIPGGIKIGNGNSIIEGVYFNGDNFNEAGAEYANYECRPEMEEAGGPQTEFGESGFAGNIGWTEPGEWVQYTIAVEKSGNYSFKAYLASGINDEVGNGNIEVSCDGTVIGRTYSEDANGWQEYDWYPVGDLYMTAEAHIIKVEFFDGKTNLAALEVTLID